MQPEPKTKPTGNPDIVREGNLELIQEGKARIHTKYLNRNEQNQLVENQVFYNPIQVFNRDLTILVMQQYINNLKKEREQEKKSFEGVNIVDALSASGLRTIRFSKELVGVKKVFANDISEASHKLMQDNFDLNNLDKQKVQMTLEDANVLMSKSRPMGELGETFDIVDLDPYGSVVPFLQSAVSSIRDGGLLCATCTDTRVTCGPDLHKCAYFYGTTRAKVHCFQQNALRIVLNCINSTANRHSRYIEPILAFQTEFYLRVFVRIHRSKTESARSTLKTGNVYNCNSCGNFYAQPLFSEKKNKIVPGKLELPSEKCDICHEPWYFNGPIWLAPINSQPFCQQLFDLLKSEQFAHLKTSRKIYGMLHAILQERELSDRPLGFNIELLSKSVQASTPNKLLMMAALEQLGYRMTGSYIHEGQFKTNASFQVLYDVLVSWKTKHHGADRLLQNVTEQYKLNILKRKPEKEPTWTHELKQKHQHVPQFFPHETKNMGPKGKPMKRVIEEPPLTEDCPSKRIKES